MLLGFIFENFYFQEGNRRIYGHSFYNTMTVSIIVRSINVIVESKNFQMLYFSQ